MESFEELIEKIKILGFTTYNSKIETLENTNWYLFPNGHNATFISMESLNMEYRLIKVEHISKYVLFICPNSGAKSKSYTFEQAYERIKKDFEDRLLFKAFNSHLFKEVETPKKIQELFDENNETFNLMTDIDKALLRCKSSEISWQRDEFLSELLYKLHEISFVEEFEMANGEYYPIPKNYVFFLAKNLGIRITSNKVPKGLEKPDRRNMVDYLKLVSAYQLLIDSNIIEEENI